MIDYQNKTIGEIVADDYRASDIFREFGIDFCCGGNISIAEACDGNEHCQERILSGLDALRQQPDSNSPNYQEWSLGFLADYIQNTHHSYIRREIPVLYEYLEKIAQVHGENHPELPQVFGMFRSSAEALLEHMKKEELVLFPAIKAMEAASHQGMEYPKQGYGTVYNPIHQMLQEHDTEGERFRKMSQLTNNYTIPNDACNTYRVALSKLEAFEKDLHKHIHLENNILFPKTVALEKSVLSYNC
jgi:regulator of cell morphogenesis and NO signaling